MNYEKEAIELLRRMLDDEGVAWKRACADARTLLKRYDAQEQQEPQGERPAEEDHDCKEHTYSDQHGDVRCSVCHESSKQECKPIKPLDPRVIESNMGAMVEVMGRQSKNVSGILDSQNKIAEILQCISERLTARANEREGDTQ